MKGVPELIVEVAAPRRRVVGAVADLTTERGAFRPAPDRWCVQEVVEHLVLAEQAGIHRVWQAGDGLRRGQPVRTDGPVHRGLPIEEIIARTWKAKEQASPNATWIAICCRSKRSRLARPFHGDHLAQGLPSPGSGPERE